MSRNSPQHRTTGAALGYDGDVIDVTLRCISCMSTQEEPMDACANARDAVAGVTCLFCGAAGKMRMTRMMARS